MSSLRDTIIQTAKRWGADYVGFGPAERFAGTAVPQIFDLTKTVICLGFRVLRGSLRGVEEGTTYYQYATTGVDKTDIDPSAVYTLKVEKG